MENEKQKSTNTYSYKRIKKQYILKKVNNIDDLRKVKESFLDPNQFLKKQKKMIIGNNRFITSVFKPQAAKKIKSLSFSQTQCLSSIHNNQKNEKKLKKNFFPESKSFTINTKSSTQTQNKIKLIRNFSCINNYNSKTKYKNCYNTYLNNLENTNNQHEKGIHYQIKSFGDMLKMFKNYKHLEEENKTKGKNIIFGNKKTSSETIKEIGKNFIEQEKALNYQKKLRDDFNLFSKSLSKKIKRKENDLLYNKIEEFRLKKQLIDLLEKSKTIKEKFGDNYWVVNLRRPKTHNDIRILYSNASINPDMIIDYADKEVEFISDPSIQNSSRYTHLLKNIDIFKKTHKYKFPNFEKMTEINIVKGKNILEKEINDFNDLKENNSNISKYRLYKDPCELKKKNMNDLTCKESYDVKYRIQRNRSYSNEESKIQNINAKINNKKKGLYRSKSLMNGFSDKENKNKQKTSYMKEAIKILQKEKKQKESLIKIISYK